MAEGNLTPSQEEHEVPCLPDRAVLMLELGLALTEQQDGSLSLPWCLCTSLVLLTLHKINSLDLVLLLL